MNGWKMIMSFIFPTVARKQMKQPLRSRDNIMKLMEKVRVINSFLVIGRIMEILLDRSRQLDRRNVKSVMNRSLQDFYIGRHQIYIVRLIKERKKNKLWPVRMKLIE